MRVKLSELLSRPALAELKPDTVALQNDLARGKLSEWGLESKKDGKVWVLELETPDELARLFRYIYERLLKAGAPSRERVITEGIDPAEYKELIEELISAREGKARAEAELFLLNGRLSQLKEEVKRREKEEQALREELKEVKRKLKEKERELERMAFSLKLREVLPPEM
jgi:septin family protein